jgi:predicted  nucleic acid-binding Zn-ribbon protein
MTDTQRGIYCALHGYKWITHEDELKEKLEDNRKRQDALEVEFAKLIAEATELEQEINRERQRSQRDFRNTGADTDLIQ